jgi:uncharacterized protein
LDFGQAAEITGLIFEADIREDYEEERWIGFGQIRGRVVALVFTLPSEGTLRVLSLREADKDEEEVYYQQAFGR